MLSEQAALIGENGKLVIFENYDLTPDWNEYEAGIFFDTSVKNGAFCGAAKFESTFYALAAFVAGLEEMYLNLHGVSKIVSSDGYCDYGSYIQFTARERGHIEISGVIDDESFGDCNEVGNKLHFCFCIDQSSMRQFVGELKKIVSLLQGMQEAFIQGRKKECF